MASLHSVAMKEMLQASILVLFLDMSVTVPVLFYLACQAVQSRKDNGGRNTHGAGVVDLKVFCNKIPCR